MVRKGFVLTALTLVSACMQPAEGPSHDKAATASFTADNVLLLARCGGYLGATGSEKQGQALVYRAGELAPSRGIDAATIASGKAEGESLAAAVAGAPAGDDMTTSCLGLYRTT